MRNAVFVSVPMRPEGGTTVKKTYQNLLSFVLGVMLLLCFSVAACADGDVVASGTSGESGSNLT